MSVSNQNEITLLDLVKSSTRKSHPKFMVLCGAVILLYFFIAAKLFVPGLQKRGLKQFHLANNSFAEWAVMQPIPAMYNYGNQIWIGNRPYLTESADVMVRPSKYFHTWLNHYPLRLATFTWYRSKFLEDEEYSYITLKSSYRGQELVSHYYLDVQNQHIELQKVTGQ